MTGTTESIGDTFFIRLEGDIDPPGMQTTDITRPGVDGRAFRQDAYRGNPFDLQGIVDTDDPTDLLNAYGSMKGSIVTIQHGGGTYTNYLVIDAKPDGARQYVANPIGGINGGHWIVKSVWTLC